MFSWSSQPSTPTLQDIQENNLGGVSSGHAMSQLHPENSQVMSPNSPGPAQPLHPAPSTTQLALEVKAPTTPSLAWPQLSLARAATMTHEVSSRSTAQSAERTQAIIQQSDDLVPVTPVMTPFQSDLFQKIGNLKSYPTVVGWKRKASSPNPTLRRSNRSTTLRQRGPTRATQMFCGIR